MISMKNISIVVVIGGLLTGNFSYGIYYSNRFKPVTNNTGYLNVIKGKTTLERLTDNSEDEYGKYLELSQEERLLNALNDSQRIDRVLASGNLSVYYNLEKKYRGLMDGNAR